MTKGNRRKFAGNGAIMMSGSGIGSDRRHMYAKWAFQSIVWIAGMAALLLVPAGTWRWPAAWVYLASMILIEASASMKGPLLMQGAIKALQACQPYAMLPADRYGEWKVLDLSFTPHDFGGAS